MRDIYNEKVALNTISEEKKRKTTEKRYSVELIIRAGGNVGSFSPPGARWGRVPGVDGSNMSIMENVHRHQNWKDP